MMMAFLAIVFTSTTPAGQQLSYESAVQNLRHPDPKVRLQTARMLQDSSYLEAAGPLAALLTDPSNDVQLAAINAELALFSLEPIQRRRRVALFIEVRQRRSASPALFERGPLGLKPVPLPAAVINGFAAAASDDDPAVRIEALFGLGALGQPPVDATVATRLAALLVDPEPDVRLAAALVIGRLGVSESGKALIYLLNDPIDRVRLAAMEALGDLREPLALVALTEQFEFYERGPFAEAALRAVARIAHPSSRSLLEAQAGSRERRLRQFAYEGLGRVGDTDALPVLDSALVSESRAEGRLAIRFAQQRLQRPALGPLVEALRDTDLARQGRDYLLELGPAIAQTLESYLHDSEQNVRRGVADVLGLIGAASTLGQLDLVRADPEPEVAAAAARAIQRITVRLPAGSAG